MAIQQYFNLNSKNWGQVQKAAGDLNAQFEGAYNIEVEMYHKDKTGNETHIGNITEFDNEITFTFDLPTGMKEKNNDDAKKYVLVRIHTNSDGTVEYEQIDYTINNDGTFTATSDIKVSRSLRCLHQRRKIMGLFGFKKKVNKNTPKYTDLDMVLGKAGQIDKNRLSKLMVNITDQASLENIALNSTIDQARMWAAGSLENKKIANDVYGQMRYSSDPLIRMAATQEYKTDFEQTSIT